MIIFGIVDLWIWVVRRSGDVVVGWRESRALLKIMLLGSRIYRPIVLNHHSTKRAVYLFTRWRRQHFRRPDIATTMNLKRRRICSSLMRRRMSYSHVRVNCLRLVYGPRLGSPMRIYEA